MATVIQLRRGATAQWTFANPTLSDGEPGYENDTGILRIGDAVTPWRSVPPILNRRFVASTLFAQLETRVQALEDKA